MLLWSLLSDKNYFKPLSSNQLLGSPNIYVCVVLFHLRILFCTLLWANYTYTIQYCISLVLNKCRTQRECGEVDGVAVGAISTLISSSDLEGVDGTRNQRVHGHCVGLTVHTHCTVHIWTLKYTIKRHFDDASLMCPFVMCVTVHRWVYLVIVSELVLQDVSVGPVRLRPW